MTIERSHILGAILAGGRSLRMQGRHKAHLHLGGQPLITIATQKLSPQVDDIVINGPPAQFEHLDHTIVGDHPEHRQQGPLAGLLASLTYADQQGYQWLASCPCDAPFFPIDYINTLNQALNKQSQHLPAYQCAVACCEDNIHPTFGLWSTALITPLAQLLDHHPQRAMRYWLRQIESLCVLFNAHTTGNNAFLNINTREQWLMAEHIFATIEMTS